MPSIFEVTNNPFMPYSIVSGCPEGDKAIITNWPEPGDRACAKNRRQHLEDQIENARLQFRAVEKNPKPFVAVEIEKPDPLTGGHAEVFGYRIAQDDKHGPHYASKVNVSHMFLKDANPSRAVDKMLIHELRHMADEAPMRDAGRSGLRWLLFEERAYLAQARAIKEQEPLMEGEPRSQALEYGKGMIADELLSNPALHRLKLLTSPLYLWHITPADIQNPEGALLSRLLNIFNLLRTESDERENILKRIDYDGGLAKAFEQATAGRSRELDSIEHYYDSRARFLELGSKVPSVQYWLRELKTFASTHREGEAKDWLPAFSKLEGEFWDDTLDFLARYKLNSP